MKALQMLIILNGMSAQTSDIFSLFIIALAIASAVWVILFKKPPRGDR